MRARPRTGLCRMHESPSCLLRHRQARRIRPALLSSGPSVSSRRRERCPRAVDQFKAMPPAPHGAMAALSDWRGSVRLRDRGRSQSGRAGQIPRRYGSPVPQLAAGPESSGPSNPRHARVPNPGIASVVPRLMSSPPNTAGTQCAAMSLAHRRLSRLGTWRVGNGRLRSRASAVRPDIA